MKKTIAIILVLVLILGTLTGCAGKNSKVINIYTFTDEVPKMLDKYVATHPDFGYTINATIIATTDGLYQPALDQALAAGGKDAPDMYCCESAFVLKYTQGDMSSYAAKQVHAGRHEQLRREICRPRHRCGSGNQSG
jgi:multiple sugar transport system substrate-binding protein